MSNAQRIIKQHADELPQDLEELIVAVEQLPEEQRMSLNPLLARVIESTKRRRRILSLVQDALSQLRLDMKYLMFDLEATRRERDDLRQQLEGN
ncbi:MAG: transcriptional regulator [Pirellulales bacterium]|nr:transcriptional regulator [Pirellulales bacterium]